MNSFEYASPTDLKSAIGLLDSRWGETEILAGGTDLVTSLKQGIVSPKRLVSLKGIKELKGIETSGDMVQIGAMTPLADILENETIRKQFPAIIAAIEGIGSPQIIAMGTVGGDLCQRPRCWYYRQGFGLLGQLDGQSLVPNGDNRYHAIFGNSGPAYFVSPSSLGPPLIALGASMESFGAKGPTKRVPVSDFFRTPKGPNDREHALAPNEIVTGIFIPLRGSANATYEIRQREGLDWPLVTASVAFARKGGGGKAAVVLGHVAPTPWSVPEAAALLDGMAVDEALATKVADAAVHSARPLSKNAYKVRLVKTAVKRAILAAAEQRES